jgi:hypothetical protein
LSLECLNLLNEVVFLLENRVHAVIIVVKQSDSSMFQSDGYYGKKLERFNRMNLNPYFVITHNNTSKKDVIFKQFEKDQVPYFYHDKTLIFHHCGKFLETDKRYQTCRDEQKIQILQFLSKILGAAEERYVAQLEKYFRVLKPTILTMMEDYKNFTYIRSLLFSKVTYVLLLIAAALSVEKIAHEKVNKANLNQDKSRNDSDYGSNESTETSTE